MEWGGGGAGTIMGAQWPTLAETARQGNCKGETMHVDAQLWTDMVEDGASTQGTGAVRVGASNSQQNPPLYGGRYRYVPEVRKGWHQLRSAPPVRLTE